MLDLMLQDAQTPVPFDLLRRDIVQGVFAPGDPLRLSALSDRYNVSATPLREALSRLEEKRLVIASRNRGWRVAPVSLDQLEDIAAARLALERALLEDSMHRGGIDWESGIVAAHHRLMQTPPPDGQPQSRTRGAWGAAHDAFHLALLSAARSERLRGFWTDTIEQLQRYHDALLYHPGTLGAAPDATTAETMPFLLENVHSAQHHTLLKEAALARDAPEALRLLDEHVAHTLEVYRSIAGDTKGTDHPNREEITK